MFQVLVSPGRVGPDDFVLQLMNGDAALLHSQGSDAELSLPERGIEAMERRGDARADGYWHVARSPLPCPAAGTCGSMRW